MAQETQGGKFRLISYLFIGSIDGKEGRQQYYILECEAGLFSFSFCPVSFDFRHFRPSGYVLPCHDAIRFLISQLSHFTHLTFRPLYQYRINYLLKICGYSIKYHIFAIPKIQQYESKKINGSLWCVYPKGRGVVVNVGHLRRAFVLSPKLQHYD